MWHFTACQVQFISNFVVCEFCQFFKTCHTVHGITGYVIIVVCSLIEHDCSRELSGKNSVFSQKITLLSVLCYRNQYLFGWLCSY